MRVLSVQRREAIRTALLEKESITIQEVIDTFGVSVETVRRDFDALAAEGFLNKVYGGATLKSRTSVKPPHEKMTKVFANGKELVASRAVRFIKPGDTIYLDNSSAVFHMCEGLMRLNITVLTNSLSVLNKLTQSKTVRVFCIGGCYNTNEDAFLGPLTLDSLKNFQVDRAFLSCKSFNMSRGMASADEQTAEVKRTIIRYANQSNLLVDHSKFDKASFANFATFEDIECLLTDECVSEHWRTYLTQHRVKIFECCEGGTEPPDIPALPEAVIKEENN